MARSKADIKASIDAIVPEPYHGDETLLWAIAAALEQSEDTVDDLYDEGLWGNATGIFLDLHAAGWGLRRATSETDASLRIRLRSYPEQVTPNAIEGTAQDLVQAVDPAETAYLLEHWEDGAFAADAASTGIDGHTFADQGVEYLPGRIGSWADGFSIILSDDIYGDPTDSRYEAIVAAIESIRPHGARWWLVVDNA